MFASMIALRMIFVAAVVFTTGRCGLGESCSHCYSRCTADHGGQWSDDCDATCGGACGN
jgi:hypothetical protein